MTFAEIAGAAYFPPNGFPLDILEPGLEETAFFDPVNFTFPGGCHVAEVEIDPDTGELALVAYTAVDDVGVVLNPMIVDGQIHGGVVQGVGPALGENCLYDPASGQLLTGSFMDYRMPRADDLPPIAVAAQSTACRHNPLGVKGCGEVGTIAPRYGDERGCRRIVTQWHCAFRHAGDAATDLASHPSCTAGRLKRGAG
jgi:carbon-monoxide dehydrogenase large subunit